MTRQIPKSALTKISATIFEIPQSYRSDMRVPARVYVNEYMLDAILGDKSLWQLINVATLPGIQKYALAMPDIHEGYGFPIGGVAAMAIDEGGVISPGGIGYDINCGVRLLASDLALPDIKRDIAMIAHHIFNLVPSGLGRAGEIILSSSELEDVLHKGAPHMVQQGYGNQDDLHRCEEGGVYLGADASKVSSHAKDRGKNQLGTLGSGNHFLELQVVDRIYDDDVARVFGLYEGQVTVMIHCGSRGLGHQVCTDYVRLMLNALDKWQIKLPDRELACAPFLSEEAQDYFMAMKAAANFSWANRHVIGHQCRGAWQSVFGAQAHLRTIYDVAHNIGKIETHKIDGKNKKLIMHRKGATRAFGPGHKELPKDLQKTGQPVLIPGTMGTASYVLAGTMQGEAVFGSACHGAGRAMSRMAAKKLQSAQGVRQDLYEKGILVCSDAKRGLAEEAPYAYKDIDEVIKVVDESHLASKVARLRPLAVIKGD